MNARWRFQNAHEVPRLKTLPGFYVFPQVSTNRWFVWHNTFSFIYYELVAIGYGISIVLNDQIYSVIPGCFARFRIQFYFG